MIVDQTNQPTLPESAMELVAERCKLPASLLTRNILRGANNPRNRRHVAARRVVTMVLRKSGWSLTHIADAMGYQSHTSILDGLRAVESGAVDKHLPEPAMVMAEAVTRELGLIRTDAVA